MTDKKNFAVWCCERKLRCKFQGFALHKGLGFSGRVNQKMMPHKPRNLRLPDYCEACGNKWPLSSAHRHERRDYKKYPEWLWKRNQVITLCTGHSAYRREGCHLYYDTHKNKREALFLKRRGPDMHPMYRREG
jgi:hypothetical protein